MKLGNQFVCASKGLSLSLALYLSISLFFCHPGNRHMAPHQCWRTSTSALSLACVCSFFFFFVFLTLPIYHVRHGKAIRMLSQQQKTFTKPNWQSLNMTPLQKLEHHRSLVDRLLFTYFLNQKLAFWPHLHNSWCPSCSPATSAVNPEPKLFHNTQMLIRARS